MPNLTVTGRAKVRKDVGDALLRAYWPTISEALEKVNSAFEKHQMFLDYEGVDFSGPEGRASILIRADRGLQIVCSACTNGEETPAFDNVYSFSWYTMESGNIECTGYIS